MLNGNAKSAEHAKHKRVKSALITLGSFGIIVIVMGALYGVPTEVILGATVISSRYDPAGAQFLLEPKAVYLSSINVTGYSGNHPIWSTRSDCKLSPGQHIAVRVPALQRFWGLGMPQFVAANTTLYQAQGVGYVQWNGC